MPSGLSRSAVSRLLDWRIAAAGIAVLVLVLAQTGLGQDALRAIGLSPARNTFVELYFPNARSLPSAVPTSHRLELRFSVGNELLATHTFHWRISESAGKATIALATGHLRIAPSHTRTVTEHLRVRCFGKRTQLVISLEHWPARISQWFDCPSV